MNALIYLRVSTKEQASKGESTEGYSIPAQREACLKHCAEQGWNVTDEFVDAGESARSSDRPNLRAMLVRVAEGDIDVLVVHKIDRLARNIEDHVAIRAGLRKAGVALVSVTETSRSQRRESSSKASTRSWPSSTPPTWLLRSERA